MPNVKAKPCDECHVIKPLVCYPVDQKQPDSRGNTCSKCKNDADKRKAKR